MNLISGKVTDSKHTEAQIEMLGMLINKAYMGEELTANKVIAACDALSRSLNKEKHLPQLMSLGMAKDKAEAELSMVRLMLSSEYLASRLEIELGDCRAKSFIPHGSRAKIRQEYKPLGVLFHIAAGNADALPAFSVIEGLLTGNINILKLPGADNGLSIAILQELIAHEPLIADYIMAFDSPSQDIKAMQKMADAADAIVVWGGDDAVSAVRKMAQPDTQIIEWGHKISFAYVSGDASERDLEKIAYNMCVTNQLFCNSCQGTYLDTDDFEKLTAFAEKFLCVLDTQSVKMPPQPDLHLDAQKTLEIYTEELESDDISKRVLKTDNCSIIVEADSALKPSYMFRNCWVKPLPKENLLGELLKYKNHLQTVALVCDVADREKLERILLKTGIVRITSGENMSQNYCGIPHDGEFPLRRYVKIVSYEY